MKRVWFLSGILALVFGGVANAVTMLDIQNNGTGCIQFGDKLFCGFSIAGPASVTATNITITGQPNSGVPGDDVFIEFNASFQASGGADNDWKLSYDVTALNGLIATIDQSFTYSAQGSSGTVGIGETVYDKAPIDPTRQKVAQSSVGCFPDGGSLVCDQTDPDGELIQGDDLIISPPLPHVWVTKDIRITDDPGAGFIDATVIHQSFHQTAVPEPIHYSLLLSGGLLVGLYFKRRKQTQA